MSGDNYIRRFQPGRNIDGDTLTTDLVDVGYHIAGYHQIEYRLYGLNCPEKNKKSQMVAGFLAKAFTMAWVAEHLHDGQWLDAETVKVPGLDGALTKTDSFGRYIATISCYEHPEHGTLNQALLDSGNAVPKVY